VTKIFVRINLEEKKSSLISNTKTYLRADKRKKTRSYH